MKLTEIVKGIILGGVLLASAGCFNKNVNSFAPKLYLNPREAFIGVHKSEWDKKGFKLEKILKKAVEYMKEDDADMQKYKDEMYDAAEEGRGAKLAYKLIEQLKDNDYQNENLLIVSVGANHMYAVGKRIDAKHNVYFFSEIPHVDNFKEFTEEPLLYTSVYNFFNKKPFKQKINPDDPNAIIFGDDHTKDFDFIEYFPTAKELKKKGVKRIIFAQEGLKPGWCKLENITGIVKLDKQKSLFDYLKRAEKEKIKVDVVGIEYEKESVFEPIR